MTASRLWVLALVTLCSGCEGMLEVSTPTTPPDDSDWPPKNVPSTQGTPATPPTGTTPPDPTVPGPTPNPPTMTDPGGTTVTCGAPPAARVWRLSHRQYDAAARAVLPVTSTPASTFEAETSGSGFTNGADTAYVSAALAADYFDAAEALAAQAVQHLDVLLPCTPADPANAACVKTFIERTGLRVFRTPLDTAQQARFFALFQKGTTPTQGVQMVLEAMLQSPGFLYRFELGGPGASGAQVPLTSYELASALSFLVWNAPPDDALLAAAKSGGLDTPAGVDAQVDRLVADPRARDFLWRFLAEDFQVGALETTTKDGAAFPAFTPALVADLQAEAHAFADDVVWNGAGTLSALLTADYSMLNQSLAGFYGVSGVTGTALRKVSLPTGQRAGLLTQGSFLAVRGDARSGSPVQRGLFVRERLLCQEMPAPPPNVIDTLPAPSATNTTRGRYQAHLSASSCAACHRLMDPIGFAFENYDGIGKWRTTENGVPVDASGELVSTKAINGTFTGALALANTLAQAREVSDCVAVSYFRYGLGRRDTPADACSVLAMKDAFAASGGKLATLARALVHTPGFAIRTRP
ncbi:MAG: DUF1592 domain-containing protein [Myxococcaceae bacterium]|nr:DUF1592 domain-containing protein [Myxococcaceae bacterium]